MFLCSHFVQLLIVVITFASISIATWIIALCARKLELWMLSSLAFAIAGLAELEQGPTATFVLRIVLCVAWGGVAVVAGVLSVVASARDKERFMERGTIDRKLLCMGAVSCVLGICILALAMACVASGAR